MRKSLLLLDDEPNIRRDLGRRLERGGFAVHKAESVEEAKKIVLAEPIQYAIVDLKVDYRSEVGGLEIVEFIKRHQPKCRAIVLSGYDITDVVLPDELVNRLADLDGFVSKKGQKNYIVAVLEMIAALEAKEDRKRCFVIMPFSSTASCSEDEWTEIFDQMVKPAVEDAGFRYECVRSDPVQGSIIEHILDNLNRADLVVADLTDRNPNVFYELGVRHTLRDGTLLIAQKLDDIPFDLRGFATIRYDWKTRNGRSTFMKQIHHAIEQLEGDAKRGTSPVRKYLEVPWQIESV